MLRPEPYFLNHLDAAAVVRGRAVWGSAVCGRAICGRVISGSVLCHGCNAQAVERCDDEVALKRRL